MIDKATIIKRWLHAYERDDRAALESTIADNFHFTSPIDNSIDRVHYIERCWPNHGAIRSFAIDRIVESDNGAYVTYTLIADSGKHVHNTEFMTFEHDKITSVEVFRGAAHDAHGHFMPQRTVS